MSTRVSLSIYIVGYLANCVVILQVKTYNVEFFNVELKGSVVELHCEVLTESNLRVIGIDKT